jgi:hypothetical protein
LTKNITTSIRTLGTVLQPNQLQSLTPVMAASGAHNRSPFFVLENLTPGSPKQQAEANRIVVEKNLSNSFTFLT